MAKVKYPLIETEDQEAAFIEAWVESDTLADVRQKLMEYDFISKRPYSDNTEKGAVRLFLKNQRKRFEDMGFELEPLEAGKEVRDTTSLRKKLGNKVKWVDPNKNGDSE